MTSSQNSHDYRNVMSEVKRVYDKEFLMKLKDAPGSKIKPENMASISEIMQSNPLYNPSMLWMSNRGYGGDFFKVGRIEMIY